MIIKKIKLVFLFVIVSFAVINAQDKLSLSIDDAIQLGLKNSKTLHSSLMNVKYNEFKLEEVNAGRLPSLSFSGSYTRLSPIAPFIISVPGLGSYNVSPYIPDYWTTKLTLEQPLFTGFRLENLSDLAELNTNASNEDYNKDKSELVFNIRSAYWNYFKAIQMKNVVDETVDQITAHLNDAKSLFNQGMLTDNDVLKIEVQLSDAKLKQIDADNMVKLSLIALCNTMSVPLNSKIDITSEAKGEIKEYGDVDNLITKAISVRPEIKSIDFKVKAGESGVKTAESGWYPQVYFVGDYNYAKPNQRIVPGLNAWRDTWDLNVSVSFNIWDWLTTKHQTDEAESQLKQLIDAQGTLKDAITLEVTQNYLSLYQSKEKISVAKLEVTQANENMKITEEKFKTGMALSSEIVDAEVAQLSAKTNYTSSLVDYELAKAKLEKSIGQ
jgi:outer membrane protein TolC